MKPISIIWDASALWGLLVWHALRELNLPFQLIRANSIARGSLPDKLSLCIVPGGFARAKAQSLEKTGMNTIRHFVKNGGNYLGFCGGAGLGLSTPKQPDESLGLCPWQRTAITERLQHFINGHMHTHILPHFLTPQNFIQSASPDILFPAQSTTLGMLSPAQQGSPNSIKDIVLPVWWPGRFAMPNNTLDPPQQTPPQQALHTSDVTVLASYAQPAHDMAIADMLLANIPQGIQQEWHDVYGVSLAPAAIYGQPCVIHGTYGSGNYILSYSHLETPDSPHANTFLCHIIERFTDLHIPSTHVPPWTPYTTSLEGDAGIVQAFTQMKGILTLGHDNDLLFPRTSWLHGWRTGVPGHGLNTLALSLAVLAKDPLDHEAARLWHTAKPTFTDIFSRFTQGTASCLLAHRLALSAPDMVPKEQLQARRMALFGSAMHADGLYQELMHLIEPILFTQCNALAAQ